MITFLYPPTIDWYYLFQRPQQLFTSFAKMGIRSIFCNADYYLPQPKGIKQLAPNLYIVNKADPYQIKMEGLPFLWITYPPHVKLINKYRHRTIIFDALDEPTEEFKHWSKYVPEIIEKSDLIIGSSEQIIKFYSSYQKTVHYIPNGVDYPHFAKANQQLAEPVDLKKIPHPRVMFVGALASWLDWDLIKAAAEARPDFAFVFIGPPLIKTNFPSGNNLYFLGRKDYRQLPNYLAHADLLTIPFRVSSMTKACNPIKYWEYLASGKPVVSTALPEVKAVDGVYIANGIADYLEQIERAISLGPDYGREKRLQLASGNSWENRARTILNLIKRTGLLQ